MQPVGVRRTPDKIRWIRTRLLRVAHKPTHKFKTLKISATNTTLWKILRISQTHYSKPKMSSVCFGRHDITRIITVTHAMLQFQKMSLLSKHHHVYSLHYTSNGAQQQMEQTYLHCNSKPSTRWYHITSVLDFKVNYVFQYCCRIQICAKPHENWNFNRTQYAAFRHIAQSLQKLFDKWPTSLDVASSTRNKWRTT